MAKQKKEPRPFYQQPGTSAKLPFPDQRGKDKIDKIVQIMKKDSFIHGLSESGNVYFLIDVRNVDNTQTPSRIVKWQLLIESPTNENQSS